MLLVHDTIGIFQDLKIVFSQKNIRKFNKKVKLLLALAKILMFLVKTIINIPFINTNKLFLGIIQSLNLFKISCIFLAIVGLHSVEEAFL